MRTVALSDVAVIERSSVQPDDIHPDEAYVGLENVTSEGTFVSVTLAGGSGLKSSKYRFDENHVLYGKLRPYLGKIAAPDFPGVCSTDIVPIRPGPDIDRGYLLHYLRTPQMVAEASRLAVGINLPRLSPKALANFEIPLPPLLEQRRIAAILDTADELGHKRREMIERLSSLKQAVFVKRFGIPQRNELSWPLVAAGDITDKIGSGATPRGGRDSYKDSGIPLIRSMNVHDARFVMDGIAFLDDAQADQLSGVAVQKGDVLLNITGASVARVCVVPDNVLPARVNQHVAIVRPTPGVMSSVFLCYVLLLMKPQLLRIGAIGATREAITKSQIQSLELIHPPIEVQREFEEQCQEIDALAARSCDWDEASDRLFVSLQSHAFRGDL